MKETQQEKLDDIPVIIAPLWAYDEKAKCVKAKSIYNRKLILNPEETKIFMLINGSNTIQNICDILNKDINQVSAVLSDLQAHLLISYQSKASAIWAEEE